MMRPVADMLLTLSGVGSRAGDVAEGAKTKIGAWVADMLGAWLGERVDLVFATIQEDLPELMTFAICICALAMMIPGIRPGKFAGYIAMIFFIGLGMMML